MRRRTQGIPHVLDRVFLAQVKVVWGFVAFTLVSPLLDLLAFGSWSFEHVTWLIGASIALLYTGGMTRTG